MKTEWLPTARARANGNSIVANLRGSHHGIRVGAVHKFSIGIVVAGGLYRDSRK